VDEHRFRIIAEHWDGSTWSLMSGASVSNANNQVEGLAAISSDDLWAVGWADGTFGRRPLTEHCCVVDGRVGAP